MITKEQFQQWASDETTIHIRNKLAEKAREYATLNYSLADRAVHDSDGDYNLEKIGLDSAMRMSVVSGIELFTDMDNLISVLDFPEEAEDEGF